MLEKLSNLPTVYAHVYIFYNICNYIILIKIIIDKMFLKGYYVILYLL